MSMIVYQADPHWVTTANRMRENLYSLAFAHLHRYVRVQMIDGHVYEGTIVQVDDRHLYLQTAAYDRAFFNPFAATILPLVLYELLVISLLA